MAAEPMPASFEKQPRETPYRIEFMTDTVIVPRTPPPTAFGLKAIVKIM